jgi:NlpC/P60 family putative phage cell wall peptidase
MCLRPTTRSETEDRALVVAEARSWILTPYHHCADVKGHGVDCAMLIVRVYVDLGFVEPFDPRPYPPDWFLHRSEERYLDHILARARRVDRPLPGDVFLLKWGRTYSHGGIVTEPEPLTVVHAFQRHRIVVEDEIGRCPHLAARLPDAVFASYWS